MFDRLKIKLEQKTTEKKPKVTKETEVTEKPETPKKPIVKPKKTRKSEKKATKTPKKTQEEMLEETASSAPSVRSDADVQASENVFVGITEYGSASEIEEHINKQISQTKSALGEYLRQLDDVRGVAEKSKKLHDIVSKVSGKKHLRQTSDQLDVNGLQIVVDATPLHELEALESVLSSHQQRLIALQKAKDALEQLDSLGDAEDIRIMVLEKQGIPEQILLKIT